MRITLVSVGKPGDRTAAALHDRYAERIRRLGVAYAAAWVPDAGPPGRYSEDHVREREAQALWNAAGSGRIVALDPAGELFTSEQIARRLERWASPAGTFLIGGPHGLHRALVERCDAAWSLSPLTFPHELTRAIAAEQIYRALTLLRRIPYHR